MAAAERRREAGWRSRGAEAGAAGRSGAGPPPGFAPERSGRHPPARQTGGADDKSRKNLPNPEENLPNHSSGANGASAKRPRILFSRILQDSEYFWAQRRSSLALRRLSSEISFSISYDIFKSQFNPVLFHAGSENSVNLIQSDFNVPAFIKCGVKNFRDFSPQGISSKYRFAIKFGFETPA